MIQQATLSEIPDALAYCSQELFDESGHPGALDMPYWIKAWQSFVGQQIGVLFMATGIDHRDIMGVLGALYFTDLATSSGKATELLWYVRPEHRGRGIGWQLHDAFEREARERGMRVQTVSRLLVSKDSEPIHKFCIGSGYKPLEQVYIKDLWAGQEQ